jgi:hypothetical protein
LSKYSKYNLNHLNILIAVLWLCCANIVVVGIKMSDFSLESDDSLSSLSDSSGDDLEELLEDRVRPKNENYFEETIPQYNEQEFMELFRVSRQVELSRPEICHLVGMHEDGKQSDEFIFRKIGVFNRLKISRFFQ